MSTALQKTLSARLAEFYDRIENVDTSHTNELMLLEYRKEDLIGKIADWDAPQRWKDLSEAFESFIDYKDRFETMGRASDQRKMDEALDKVAEIVSGGYIYEYLGWQELRSVADQIRKTKDSENSRRAKAAENVSDKQVQMLIGYVINSVMNNVTDPDERKRVLEDLKRINIDV